MSFFRYAPFRNLIKDYSRHTEWLTDNTALPYGTPTAGPAQTPSDTPNADLALSFNRHGRTVADRPRFYSIPYKRRWARLYAFKDVRAADAYIDGHRVQTAHVRLGKLVLCR